MSLIAIPLTQEIFVIDWDENKIVRKYRVPTHGKARIPKRVTTFAARLGSRTKHCIVIAQTVAYF